MDHVPECNLVANVETLVDPSQVDSSTTPSEISLDSQISRKRSRKTSDVWQHFHELEKLNEDGTLMKNAKGQIIYKAVCKVCSEDFVCGGTNGTNHLRRHVESCANKTKQSGSQTIIGTSPNGPQFKPPTRNTLRNDVISIFKEKITDLKVTFNDVPGRICFTSDLWSSNQKLSYMCITAHYITSDWNLHKRVINFSLLPSPHTGAIISEAIYANLLGWNISDKVGTITLDNASNNDAAVARLKDYFFAGDLLRQGILHVRCNAHVTNLLVKAGLEHVEQAVDNIRESVRHVKSSSSRLQKFFDCCRNQNMKEKRLPMDVDTRWDATYHMLVAAIPYKKVFELYFYDSNFPHVPSALHWQYATVMQEFLGLFNETTKLFSGRRYVSSSLFCYQISKISILLKRYSNKSGFELMCAQMKLKFDKYWKEVPLALGFASCMDPRYKFTILGLCLDLNFEHDVLPPTPPLEPSPVGSTPPPTPTVSELKLEVFKRKLSEMFDDYQHKFGMNGSAPSDALLAAPNGNDVVFDLLSRRRERSNRTCKSDLQRYLDQPTYDAPNDVPFDVLQWWKANESTYPILAAMARDLLTIPVSTVASESAFSGSERVVSKYRSCLLPETVEALVCLKDWFDAEDGFQDEGVKELEALMGDMEM